MNKRLSISSIVLTLFVILWTAGCKDKATDISKKPSEFETIKHACQHMMDAGFVVDADSILPGPHLDEAAFEHTRLKVALVKRDDDSTYGYIHIGPSISGDMYVMTSEDVPLAVTNRTISGDTELEIEKTFSARQIADSANCTSIKKAIIFEAQTGANIIKIGPTTFDTVSVLIEEGRHEAGH